MSLYPGVTLTQHINSAARGWLFECGIEIPDGARFNEVQAMVDRQYEGGWAQFLSDQDVPPGTLL